MTLRGRGGKKEKEKKTSLVVGGAQRDVEISITSIPPLSLLGRLELEELLAGSPPVWSDSPLSFFFLLNSLLNMLQKKTKGGIGGSGGGQRFVKDGPFTRVQERPSATRLQTRNNNNGKREALGAFGVCSPDACPASAGSQTAHTREL
jgi:hypothetical protein